jgi:UDP-N-acetylglucosamine acyltransferase
MKRRGYSRVEIHRARSLYRQLFLGEDTFEHRLAAAEREFANDVLGQKILRFIRERGSRPLLTRTRRGTSGGADVDDLT